MKQAQTGSSPQYLFTVQADAICGAAL